MKTIYTFAFILFALNVFAQTDIIAHRGASYLAPENTVASANKAWELGADAVEVDIHLSKDNRVMVMHDKDTKRTCSGKKNLEIAQNPSVLLRDLDAGIWKGDEFKGEKIPYISEIIETVPSGKTLVIEIKCGKEVIEPLIRTVEKSGKQKQIVFISFNWKTILAAQKAFPENKCYWLSSLKPGLTKKMEQAAKAGLAGVNLKHSIIDAEIIEQAKKNKLEVLCWTVDDADDAKRLSKMGVSGITTNRPKWLKDEMSK